MSKAAAPSGGGGAGGLKAKIVPFFYSPALLLRFFKEGAAFALCFLFVLEVRVEIITVGDGSIAADKWCSD